MTSLDLLLTTAESERASQRAHFEALDAKAGLLLGFAGALIALSPGTARVFRLPATLGLVVAAGLAAAAFAPRRLPVLEVANLRRYLRADEEFTRLTLFDTYLEMVRQGADELRRKARLIKLCVLFLALSAGTLAIGIVAGGNHG